MFCKRNFSLIEVLVILGVISILSVLIFNAGSLARDKAKLSTCLNNLKQIQTVYEVYRKDHRTTPYNPFALSNKTFGDFTFAENYVNTDNLSSFICPGDNNSTLSSIDDLDGNTSYSYIPSEEDVEEINTLLSFKTQRNYDLASSNVDKPVVQIDDQYLVIYDKSKDNHNGALNIVYLHGLGNKKAGIATSLNPEEYEWASTSSGDSSSGDSSSGDSSSGDSSSGDSSSGDSSSDNNSNGKGKNNNGHGNNVDGVDSSNPGKSKQGQDSDPNVDDEKKKK